MTKDWFDWFAILFSIHFTELLSIKGNCADTQFSSFLIHISFHTVISEYYTDRHTKQKYFFKYDVKTQEHTSRLVKM
jgi:hypothetical protein